MKVLTLIGIILGILLTAGCEKLFGSKVVQTLEPDSFWKVNGSYANEGEIYETFYPPLESLEGAGLKFFDNK